MASPVLPPETGRRGFGTHVQTPLYDRYRVNDPQVPLVAQVLVVPSGRLRMSVREAQDAIDLDFRHTVTRPDLPGRRYQTRPGHHLTDILDDLTEQRCPAILFNGNNVGWWGNQFVIRRKQLRFKPKGPIFDDGNMHTYATGHHAFFSPGPSGFRIVDIELEGSRRDINDTGELDLRALKPLPRCGLSGFPLIRNGKAAWKKHGDHAWDPSLLFNLGASLKDGPVLIREFVSALIEAREELARHPMTVIGIDKSGDIVLLVVEKSDRSRGMTVAEADRLLRRRFAVQDAIVLGAAGDAQLATTAEGFLTVPFVASYAKAAARRIPDTMLNPELAGRAAYARPVPCYVILHLGRSGPPAPAPPTTAEWPVSF